MPLDLYVLGNRNDSTSPSGLEEFLNPLQRQHSATRDRTGPSCSDMARASQDLVAKRIIPECEVDTLMKEMPGLQSSY